MSNVLSYLDCGCAIKRDGSRVWCPTCLNPPSPVNAGAIAEVPAMIELLRELGRGYARIDSYEDDLQGKARAILKRIEG